MFKPVKNPPDFPSMEHDILEFWDREKIFQRSIDQREGNKHFVFYDGPPGTNGPPHIGHLMQSALKDLWPRYKTMRGEQVLRKAGWDTHGLPVELTADRDLGLQSKLDIEKYGVKKYTEYCQSTVYRYKSSWEEAIHRSGRFLDLENFYATFKNSYIQSDWWVLKQAWNTRVSPEFENINNLAGNDRFLYKDYRISAWCPQQGTTLSNFEVAQGYKEVTELTLFPKFRVCGEANTYLVAWTTTAWTLLSNLAIAAGPDLEYVKVRLKEDVKAGKKDDRIIVAKSRLEQVEKFIGDYEVEGSFPGSKLADLQYEPLWDWQSSGNDEKRHFVIVDNFVTADEGTGLVHLAPYGEDDFRLIKQNDLRPVLMVNQHGIVEDQASEFSGKWFKDSELELSILKNLAARNLLLGKEKHEHTYPFHYKTGSPLMYFPRPGWFIRTTAMREEMIEANNHINWYPSRVRDGRFGKWLENVVDWNITRERFWGSPLPVWSSENGDETVTVESIKDLNEHLVRSGGSPLSSEADLHKPGIDEIILKGKNGNPLKRQDFVLDSWFNAGIMPWGQIGYPSEPGSIEYFNRQYPADFICEGLDQTRGWFYSMLACSTLIAISSREKDKNRWSSYKNVICTDLVLDESGEKMSKSKGNVVAPLPVMEKFGADAVRWSFYRNNPWNPVRFGEEALGESLRQVFIPLWNAYSFFVTYANVDGWSPSRQNEMADPTYMDRWILTCYHDLIENVTENLESFDVMPAASAITDFVDRLTNWYIRRSRRRFWKSDEKPDKERAYSTLYTVLTGTLRILAPFAPFITEEIYQNLEYQQKGNSLDSVHLTDWPEPINDFKDDQLKESMDLVRQIVSLGHSARNDARLKVRQPLSRMTVILEIEKHQQISGLEDLVLDELNIKKLEFTSDSSDFISYSAKANFKALGPRFGKDVKKWAEIIAAADFEQTRTWFNGGSVNLSGEDFGPDDVVLSEVINDRYIIKEESGLTIALDSKLDDDLRSEGYAREIINKIQNKRKTENYEVTQRIDIRIESASVDITDSIKTHEELISREVLGSSIRVGDLNNTENLVKINDQEIWLFIEPSK